MCKFINNVIMHYLSTRNSPMYWREHIVKQEIDRKFVQEIHFICSQKLAYIQSCSRILSNSTFLVSHKPIWKHKTASDPLRPASN